MILRHLGTAAIAVSAMIAGAPSFAADSRLDHVAQEVRAQTGGTLLSVRPHARGAQFEVVLLSPNGVVQTALYNAARAEVESVGPSTAAEAPMDTKAIRGAQISLNEAVQTAEKISGTNARSARFISNADADMIAYRVTMADGSSGSHIVLIDARNGQALPGTSLK